MAITLGEKLLEKAKEAFLLSIEIYNKPTIKYRVEGFTFFICNAWELMLKSYLIKRDGEESIFYKDNKDRSISLEVCIKTLFTNNKDPLRKNLEAIVQLRNQSTHLVTEEYELIYVSIFQACVFNFVEKIKEFHNFDVSELIPQNFLNLVTSINELSEETIRAKYPSKISDKIISLSSNLSPMVAENNNKFAIKIITENYLTKNPNKATNNIRIVKDAGAEPVKIIKQLQDPNETHKYPMKRLNKEVERKLKQIGVNFKMNQHVFSLFNKAFDLKNDTSMCYVYKGHAQPSYTYSQKAIDFIVTEIKKRSSKHSRESEKENFIFESTPGAKEILKHHALLLFRNPAILLHELTTKL